MSYSRALKPLSVAEALAAAALCLIVLPTATEQHLNPQQHGRQNEDFIVEPGACKSTILTRTAAASRISGLQVICCRGIRYRFNFRPSSSRPPVHRLSDYRCCYNYSGWVAIYDTKKAMCCGGKVITFDLSRDLKCCNGEEVYNASTHICCVDDGLTYNESKIHHLPSFAERHHFCCGKEYYNSLTHKCCSSNDRLDNLVHTIPHEEAQEIVPKVTDCCGSEIYKTTSDLVCHDDNLINEAILCANSQGSEWQNDSHICCSGNVAPKPDHVCCEGVLHRVSDGSRCCGSHYVGDKEYLCCNGTAYPHHNSADMACCGSSLFNQSTHRCYGTKVIRNYNGLNAIRCGEGDAASFIDPSKHICCNGSGYLKQYNLCCNGKHYSRSELIHECCCGSQKYNTATHSCTAAKKIRHGAAAVITC